MKPLVLLACLLLSGCVSPAERGDVRPGDLPPIAPTYRQAVVDWARGFYAAPRQIRNARISDPVLARDDHGRLLWLVCVEAAQGAGPAERQALGFAPNWVSTPLARGGSTLVRSDCDRPLAWRPFPALQRL